MSFISFELSRLDITRIEEYIDDDFLSFLKKTNAWICGGSILACMDKRDILDVDLFFPNMDGYWDTVQYFKKKGIQPVFNSKQATTFELGESKIQLIKKGQGTPIEKILDSFDINICKIGFCFKEQKAVAYEDFWTLTANNEMTLSDSIPTPINTLSRVCKYTERGYYIPGEELLRLGLMISKLEIKTYGDLVNHIKVLGITKEKEFIKRMFRYSPTDPIDDSTLQQLIKEISVIKPINKKRNVIESPMDMSSEKLAKLGRMSSRRSEQEDYTEEEDNTDTIATRTARPRPATSGNSWF